MIRPNRRTSAGGWLLLSLVGGLLAASCGDSPVGPANQAVEHQKMGLGMFDVCAGDGGAMVYWFSGSSDSATYQQFGLEPPPSVSSVDLLVSEDGPERGFTRFASHSHDGLDTVLVDNLENGRLYWFRLKTRDLQGQTLGESEAQVIMPGPVLEPYRRIAGVQRHSSYCWSPSGARLALVQYVTEVPPETPAKVATSALNIAILDLATSRLQPVTRILGGEYVLWGPTWSPDGNRLAYGHSPSQTNYAIDYRIWTVDLSDRISRGITSGRWDSDPAWLSTGDVVFTRRSAGDQTGHDEIHRADAAQGWSVRQLTDDRGVNRKRYLSVSHPGDVIAFSGEGGIYTVPSEGGAIRNVVPDAPWSAEIPSWAPDGRTLLFDSDRCGHPEIWSIDTVNLEIRQVTRGIERGYWRTTGTLSADGSLIAYLEEGWESTGGLVIAPNSP